MRTNIDINDELISKAMAIPGIKTKREAVEKGLEALVRLQQQKQIRKWYGKLKWEGDLEASRLD